MSSDWKNSGGSPFRRVFRLPLTRRRVTRQVEDELSFHVAERVEELVQRGMSRADAEAEVRRTFGDVSTVRDTCVAIDARSARRRNVRDAIASVVQDAAFAVRTLRRRPAFAATAILTLALGIGATTAMFTVVDGVLLQPLPYRDPARLVTITTTFPHWKGRDVVGALWNTLRTPYPDYANLVKGQRALEGVAGFSMATGSLTLGETTVSITEGFATANLLSVLGARPAHGRWFLPGEDGPSAQPLAVLSHESWQTRYGGEASIIGHTIHVDERPYTVIGIMPRGFGLAGRLVERPGTVFAEVWLPFGIVPNMVTAGNHTMELIGRLRSGVTIDAALADVEPLLRGDRPTDRRGAAMVPRAEVETREVQRPLLLLFAGVGVVLLITCGNIALLFLSECVVRQPELRTRTVLGAGRSRLIRLLLTESAVIAVAGATVGVVLGWWGTRAMLALAPVELPHAQAVTMNVRVLLFAIGVGSIVALIAGLTPAITLTKRESASGTHGRIASGRSRMQTFVVGLQACLAVVLMTGSGLLVRSLFNERRVDPGFRFEHMLGLRVELPRAIDRERETRNGGYESITRALESTPGVVRVTSAMHLPLSGRTNGQAVSVPPEIKLGAPGSAESENANVAASYFDVLRIPVLAGRAFDATDVPDAPPVGVVSEGFARRFWPGESALGKQFRSPNGVVTVVGIVGDVRNKMLSREAEVIFYRPVTQSSARLSFVVETRGEPRDLAKIVERTVWATMPGATVSDVTPLSVYVDRAVAPARYRALLATIFAGLALLLTTVGLAGLTARGVARRLRELCIRIALGATPRHALGLAMLGGLGAVVVGLVSGMALSPIAARLLSEYLYGVSGRDLVTYAATVATALATCGVATLAATKRLRRADLAAELRSD